MSEEIPLSAEFIDRVKASVKPHWGKLGWVIYKRTYACWLPEKGRSKNWDETINLDPRLQDSPSLELKQSGSTS